MTINPLDFPGNPVQFEAVNLKPDAGHTKEGIPYKWCPAGRPK